MSSESKFLSELVCKELEEKEGSWVLVELLAYQSELLDETLEVPVGFVTDFSSVPRIPFIYAWYGDRAHRESVLHDWLYFTAYVSRAKADSIFLEAMKARGKSLFVRNGMYLGVRLGGWKAWKEHRAKRHPMA